MLKFLISIKKAILFMLSAFIVAWFSTGALFALFESIEDEEVQTLFRQNFSTAYMVVFQEAIIAFTLTYIIAKQVINKKTNKWLWRIIWYILADIVLFFALCILP